MNKELINIDSLYQKVKTIIENGKIKAFKAVNTAIVESNWNIGKEIIEEEQKGETRADYGKLVISNISKRLTDEFGSGYSPTNLKYMRQFYMTFPKSHPVSDQLSWTHYRLLLKIKDENARKFYSIETINNNWSSRELDRQISSLLFERLSISKDKEKVKELATLGQIIEKPSDAMKSHLILEFLGKGDYNISVERDLESALMDKLQMFLLELGKGFSFVARQKRINVDGDNYFIDLVFYNYVLKCFVLIDLKMGKLSHRDIGQMDFYVRYFEKEMKLEGDNPTIGLLLCADKNDSMVKYTLLDESKNIFASKYQFYLPTEEQLIEEIERERIDLELEFKPIED